MPPMVNLLLDIVFEAAVIEWRGLPVEGSIATTTCNTSLFPKDGGYLLP
jgi:hypothetical protein